ncbi:MAG: TetR/AcrR family transcriptional regulator [Actinomycetota bacterium]|nr:TetR/AcrR family transcriptional regulator [Actinomycetota bacterium]
MGVGDASGKWQSTPARRASILEAALKCFSARGVAATSMEELRKASGASIGSIYHHFGGKEQLAAALYVEALRRYHAGSVGRVEKDPPAEEGIRSLVAWHLRWVEANPDLARYLFAGRAPSVRLAGGAELREANRSFFKVLEAWRRRRVEEGTLKPMSSDLFYAVLIGPAQEFARHWLAGRTTTSMEDAVLELPEGAWRALRADP